ncbi:Gfo/Idh/MocA family protein [Phnomibacter ginsenosidimutans]|uniref:Gfo/Idh/MocA family oxidoreductase n=1 Tax=Phnomibacter ginsenosidimutans TaxID=2676868 RepID=A0A6I6GBA5_9BACT|nr:Gfo/Idh/MocA family oxidoreductase [Phnomibacter ginsenosidimutans]QGW27420.1 gfo/Idh/MocA family oxidoreductase [Phnomibacter ginsenosidimutans]
MAGASALPFISEAQSQSPYEKLELSSQPINNTPKKPVTVITIGAGARGNIYGDYAIDYPKHLDIVSVAEPIPFRNDYYAQKHNIPAAKRFSTWEDVFKIPKFADAVIISTPDNLHYEPCMAALKAGYDVLLEKPISPSEKECRDILHLTQKTGRIVAVCHVLRYSPYFIQLRNLIQSGAIGQLASIQHFEPIEHTHMAHSYVRGNWKNSKESTPIILAKSCHDLDIIKWMIGKKSTHIQAFGNLMWFKEENAPAGSTSRCTDGCAVEKTCPYSAIRIYYEERQRQYAFDLPEDKSKHGEYIMNYLRTGPYGKCVYRVDNDQCDHYVTNMQFEDGVTASFSMEAFTPWGDRRTRIMGSMGYIEGDMNKFTIYDFRTKESKTIDAATANVANYKNEGHGGGDYRLVNDWIQAVSQQKPSLLSSTIEASIESHVMGFKAEESRKTNTVQSIDV